MMERAGHILKNIFRFSILLAMISVAMTGCHKNTADPADDIEDVGKGTGQIEFQGNSYPLNASLSYKMTSWSPPPLGIQIFDSENNDNAILIAISGHLYNTWPAPTIGLPLGTYEKNNMISIYDFRLSDGTHGLAYSEEMFNLRMDVKRSGNIYDITLTGKIMLLSVDAPLQDFKITWKGEIKVIENEEIPIR